MERIESSETSAYINTLTPGTYPKEKKLQSKHSKSLKSRTFIFLYHWPSLYMKINTYTYKQCLSSDSTQWCTVKFRITFLCTTWGHIVWVDVYFHSLLAVAWDGGECSASCTDRLTHSERTPDTCCIGDLVGCGDSWDILEKKKNSLASAKNWTIACWVQA